MTKKEAIMAMYVSALPVVLQDWFTAYARPFYEDATFEHHGSEAAGTIREFIADYTAEAIKQANKLENNL